MVACLVSSCCWSVWRAAISCHLAAVSGSADLSGVTSLPLGLRSSIQNHLAAARAGSHVPETILLLIRCCSVLCPHHRVAVFVGCKLSPGVVMT